MGTHLEAMKRALETLEDVFGKDKVDVTAINMLREEISKPEKQARSVRTQDMKILATDFMSHPLSRGISDCEKAGEMLHDAAVEIERLREQVSSLESSPMSEEALDILRSENDILKQHLREEGDRIAHLRNVLMIVTSVAQRYVPYEHPALQAAADVLTPN